MASGNNIRYAAVYGSFYPGEKQELNSFLENFFTKANNIAGKKNIKALIVPHAGFIYSGQTATWGYRQLPIKKGLHFVLVGPSHHFPFSGLAASSADYWQTPLGKVKQTLEKTANDQVIYDNQIHHPEHCLEVQLPFLQYLYRDDFSVSCFLTGQYLDSKYCASFLLENFPKSIFVISSDLSHYLPQEETEIKDKKTIENILELNQDYLLSEENSACGAVGITILLSLAKINHWKGKLIHYDTSATNSKDKSAVVGYASIAFYE